MVMKKMETQSMRWGRLINYRNGHQTRVCHQFMNSFRGTEPKEGEEMRQMGYLVAQDFSSEFFISWVMFVFHMELANFKL